MFLNIYCKEQKHVYLMYFCLLNPNMSSEFIYRIYFFSYSTSSYIHHITHRPKMLYGSFETEILTTYGKTIGFLCTFSRWIQIHAQIFSITYSFPDICCKFLCFLPKNGQNIRKTMRDRENLSLYLDLARKSTHEANSFFHV